MTETKIRKLEQELAESRDAVAALARENQNQKNHWQALQREGAFFKAMVKSVNDLVFAVDPECRLIFANNPFRKFFQQLFDQEIKLRDHVFGPMSDERRTFWQKNISRTISKGSFRFDQQYFIQNTRLDIEWAGEAVLGNDGVVLGAVMRGRDLAPLRIAEEALRERDAQVHHAQKLEAVGALTGGVAHEFNNTLSIVLGNLELCITEIKKGHPARPYIDDAKSGILRAKKVARQLLDFSRKSDGKWQDVEVHTLVTNALSLLRASIPAHIEFHQHIETCPPVKADPSNIHQLIINLCTNAADAMSQEGGVMTVSLEHIKLRAGKVPSGLSLSPGPYAKLTVADTGPGMDADTLGRIYEPFFTTKGSDRGTGLGLTVAKGIVRKYEGNMVAHSKVGRGSKFEVYLPAATAAETKPAPPPDPAALTGSERILLVDDEPKFVIITQRQLELLGYKVEIFTSSKSAWERFKAAPEKFDLVISDVAMPKMTGENLVKQIRQLRPNLPVILCTGYSEKVDQQTASLMGCEYMIKPIEIEYLGLAIRKSLDRQ